VRSKAAATSHRPARRPLTLRPPAPPRSGAAHPTELGEAQFHRLADAALERALEALEALVDEADLPGADAELGQGVLTLRLGALGTYVLNKQGPNRQLWLSSPVRCAAGWAIFVVVVFDDNKHP
jgi:frataxin-like iron-binding protein CyaY